MNIVGKGSAWASRCASSVAAMSDTAQAGPPPFTPAPRSAVNDTGQPVFGGYSGIVATTGLAALVDDYRFGGNDPLARARRAVRRKAWVYLFAATQEVSVVAALVNGGITGSGFMMITDLRTGEVIADSSRQGALARINDAPGDGLRASYRLPGTRYEIARDGADTRFTASLGRAVASLPGRSQPWLDVDLVLRETGTGITAISEVRHDSRSAASVTGKTAGLAVTGAATVHSAGGASRAVHLDGGIGGYDYTNGFLPRTTAWRWAYATGPLQDGTVLGFNLSEGFSGVGERGRENAVWIDGRPFPLDSRTRFTFDRADLLAPWQVTTVDGTVRLRFEPLALHREHLDIKVMRSHFMQPVGHFSGEIDVAGRTHVLDRVPGVTEDQDILW